MDTQPKGGVSILYEFLRSIRFIYTEKKKWYDELVYSFEKYRVENSYPIRYNLSV